jgi:serine/threonine protein phosphatase PrpC
LPGKHPWRLTEGQSQPGIAADAASFGDLDIRAASIVGPGHRCDDPATPRQDAYALARTRDGRHLIVAVADGLSSSARSEIGARVAASASARLLADQFERLTDPRAIDAQQLFVEVSREMVGTGRERNIREDELSSLLVVAAIPVAGTPSGGRTVWTAQVGDVSVWLHGERGWHQATGVQKAGFDRNKVDAVLPFSPREATQTLVDVPPRHGVAVVTDGFGDLLSDVAGVQDFLSRRWARPPHPAAFVSDLCADAPGQTDDRTAVVVWCGDRSTA